MSRLLQSLRLNTMAKSRITLDIDLAAQGKRVGHARLPHSVNRSAYGWLPIPIASIRNGKGPTVLLMAGTHGDEYEGQVVLTRLFQALDAADVSGQLIFLPMANYPAAKAGLRVSPIDQGNLNRLYPGDPHGTPTQMIAHFIESELMGLADLAIDLHSGGSSLNYLAASTTIPWQSPQDHARAREYLRLFGLPYGLVFPNAGNGSSFDAAARNNILRIGTELGGRGWINADYRKQCETGVLRILASLGVLDGGGIPAPSPVQLMEVEKKGFVYARAAGLFESQVQLGDPVKAGDQVGTLYFPDDLARAPLPVHVEAEGTVVCERAMAPCEPGDCLLHLARPL
jgi:predicted deacylase